MKLSKQQHRKQQKLQALRQCKIRSTAASQIASAQSLAHARDDLSHNTAGSNARLLKALTPKCTVKRPHALIKVAPDRDTNAARNILAVGEDINEKLAVLF